MDVRRAVASMHVGTRPPIRDADIQCLPIYTVCATEQVPGECATQGLTSPGPLSGSRKVRTLSFASLMSTGFMDSWYEKVCYGASDQN